MSVAVRSTAVMAVVCSALLLTALAPTTAVHGDEVAAVDHLVVSELVTGGAGASDELIEIHNPSTTSLPLEGLELVYVTASGATISRRAAWDLDAPSLPPGGHALVANEAGVYATMADATYVSGLAASGGSVALRIQGAATAIDAVGWGTAASSWLEGTAVPAPAAGSSIERLPGGPLGSNRDTDDNASDFAQRLVPDPQNLGSPPTPDPAAPPTFGPSASAPPSAPSPPTPSPTPSQEPMPEVVPIAIARGATDGSEVTIEGVAFTGSEFHDGGGFLADPSGGIAVLLDAGRFDRGTRLRVSGTIDDRFSQRTIRAAASDIVDLGGAVEPAPEVTSTGSVNESVEGRLVRIAGVVTAAPTTLTSGLALDIDDGSGATRIIVGAATGIDASSWTKGVRVDVVGVAGQRDSSGSGVAGYRVMPRDAVDVIAVEEPSSPPPGPSGSPGPEPTASSAPDGVVPISAARSAPKNARLRLRGVVTMPPGIVDPVTAVVQDGSGAIVLRLGGAVGKLQLSQRIEVSGTRSTLSGMETLRVTQEHEQLGMAAQPVARRLRTGDAAESHEATLVTVRGSVVASARRAGSGTVSFEIDDGSGALRVVLAAALGANDDPLIGGTWVEVTGVLGQETTGAEPLRGYRVWPRSAGEVRIVAAGNGAESVPGGGAEEGSEPDSASPASLDEVGGPDLADLRVGATLVSGPWEEIGVGGLLWDGSRLVAIDTASSARVGAVVDRHSPPVALDLGHLRVVGSEPTTGAPLVRLGGSPDDILEAETPPVAPRSDLSLSDGAAAWVSVVGRLVGPRDAPRLRLGSQDIGIELRCEAAMSGPRGIAGVTGVAMGEPVRLLVGCDGIRAAPGLARSAAPAAAIALRDGPAAASNDDAPVGARRLAGGLLLLAAITLLGGAAARRWLDARRPEQTGDDASPTEADHEEPGSGRLTLVRVPHEHGS